MCERIKTPDGGVLIVCGSAHAKACVHCGQPGVLLCDWKVKGRRSGTCDRALCARCAREVAPGKHLCRGHALDFEDWKRRRGEDAARVLVRRQPEQMMLIQ